MDVRFLTNADPNTGSQQGGPTNIPVPRSFPTHRRPLGNMTGIQSHATALENTFLDPARKNSSNIPDRHFANPASEDRPRKRRGTFISQSGPIDYHEGTRAHASSLSSRSWQVSANPFARKRILNCLGVMHRSTEVLTVHPRKDLHAVADVGPKDDTNHLLRSILNRLSVVEAKLEHVDSPIQSTTFTTDLASIRSILSPAMQASSDDQFCTKSGTTPIYNDQYIQRSGDLTDLLSLRRNLSSPEEPPFGVWWTYTIEEMLSWPVFEFQEDINEGLDSLMDYPDDNSDSIEDLGENPYPEIGSSLERKIDLESPIYVKRGLDDGMIVPELIESFLRNVHIKNPVLNTTLLRDRADNMVENGMAWDGETCQVLLACALGAISEPWNTSDLYKYSGFGTSLSRYKLAKEYFQMAQRRVGIILADSSLISAQCLFLTGVFLLYIQKPVAGWRTFNSASIVCRSYISKRIARRNKALSVIDTHSMEQRLCWSCIKSEREIAVEFGMETSGLNVLAYSTSLPTPPNGYASDINQATSIADNGELPTQVPGPSSSSTPYEERSWYYYLTEIMLRKLEMRIDIFAQDKRKEAYRRAGEEPEVFFGSLVQALQEFDYQLTLYYQSLPPIMNFPMHESAPCTDDLRHYLRWRLFSARHDITLPALYILLHNDITGWAHDLVGELVQLTNICLDLDMKFLCMGITTHRHQSTWLGLRKGVRSALVLIAAQKLRERQIPGLENLLSPDLTEFEQGAKALVKGLRYWSKESRDCLAYLSILKMLHPIFE